MRQPKDMSEGTVHHTNKCGTLVILEYQSSTRVLIEFELTGYRKYSTSHSIRYGSVKDPLFPCVAGVGYIGVGEHKPSGPAAAIWRGMLTRCYGEGSEHTSYNDVEVCEEWHNLQNFAEWFYENLPDDYATTRYQLDKDELSEGGKKIYSPSTCQFVTPAVNNAIRNQQMDRKSYRLWRDGRVYKVDNIVEFCAKLGISRTRFARLKESPSYHCKGFRLIPDGMDTLTEDFIIESEKRAKEYHFMKDGEKVVVRNLRQFCLSNGLAEDSMRRLRRCKNVVYKGYSYVGPL